MFSAEKNSGGDFSGWITFTSAFINVGNGLNANTGIFQAPEAGSYLFGVKGSTARDSKDFTTVTVYHNNDLKFQISDGNKADEWNNIGATWLWQLSKDDTVRLKVHYHKLSAIKADKVLFWGFRISNR